MNQTARSTDASLRTALPAAHLQWAQEQIRTRCSPASEIVRIYRIPSRLAEVYRVVAGTPDGQKTFYLKRYPPSKPEADLRERFNYLDAIAGAFERSDVVSPYRVIGSDAQLGLLLTLETAGTPLLTIHHTMTRRLGFVDATPAVRAWHGLGVWLGILHWRTVPPTRSTTRVEEVLEYSSERFRKWAERDPGRGGLAKRAVETVAFVAGQAAGHPVTITLCHGDISAGNVIVGKGVSLVDPDDLRLDMPALDISQALMELHEFGFVASVVPLPGLAKSAQASFVAGYGHALPEGPEFWLPHLRNLSVYVLTSASRCQGLSLHRLTEEARYRRTIQELKRCIRTIRSSGAQASYLG